MELMIVAIIVVAVVLVLIFAGPSTNSNRSIINEPYKPIEMPMYKQSTYSSELNFKPDDKSKPLWIVPDNLTTEIFTRTNTKAVKKEGAKAEKIFKKSKLDNPSPKKKSKKDDTADNSNSNFDSNVAMMSASDDDRKSSASCTPSHSSRSCESPVESYSSNSYSSSSDSSSSSCDSGGGSCGGGGD